MSDDDLAQQRGKAKTAGLERDGTGDQHRPGWTYVVMPNSAKYVGTRGLVKISGTADGHPFRSSFMALGDGRHMLPTKADVRKAISKQAGDTVPALTLQRLSRLLHELHQPLTTSGSGV